MIKVIPSILSDNPKEAVELLMRCDGVVDRVSFDFIDGVFVDNKTIRPHEVDLARYKGKLKFDAQLMVDKINIIDWVSSCAREGFDRIVVHVESINDFCKEYNEKWAKIFDEAIRYGGLFGVGVDLPTGLDEVTNEIVRECDVVLLMSVPAGFGGQEFREEVIEKIKRLSDLRKENKYKFKIHVDGGIKLDNIRDVVEAGADEVSVGRRIFKGDLGENVKKYKEAVARPE